MFPNSPRPQGSQRRAVHRLAVPRPDETAEQRRERIEQLKELVRQGRFDEQLIPEGADLDKLLEAVDPPEAYDLGDDPDEDDEPDA